MVVKKVYVEKSEKSEEEAPEEESSFFRRRNGKAIYLREMGMSPERKSLALPKPSPFKSSNLVNQINDEMNVFMKVTPKEWGKVRETQDGRLHSPERWSHYEDNYSTSGQRFSRVDPDGTLRFARFENEFDDTMKT